MTGYGTTIWDPRTNPNGLMGTSNTSGYSRVLAFSPSGESLATGHDSGMLRVYNAGSGALMAWMPVERAITSLAWSPDGEQLAVGTD